MSRRPRLDTPAARLLAEACAAATPNADELARRTASPYRNHRAGITRSELAQRAGVSVRTLQRWCAANRVDWVREVVKP